MAWVSGCFTNAPLKPMARLRIRPSSSGKATFIARSRAVKPALDCAQSCWRLAARTTCKTGASTAPNGPTERSLGSVSAPPANVFWLTVSWLTVSCLASDTAKLVKFRMISALACCRLSATMAALSGSFRLATNSGNGFRPANRNASINESIGAVSPACIKAR